MIVGWRRLRMSEWIDDYREADLAAGIAEAEAFVERRERDGIEGWPPVMHHRVDPPDGERLDRLAREQEAVDSIVDNRPPPPPPRDPVAVAAARTKRRETLRSGRVEHRLQLVAGWLAFIDFYARRLALVEHHYDAAQVAAWTRANPAPPVISPYLRDHDELYDADGRPRRLSIRA